MIPFALASINLSLDSTMYNFSSNGSLNTFFTCLLIPILPVLLLIYEQKTFAELKYCSAEKFPQNLKKYRIMKNQLCNLMRTELCLETSLQILFSTLLLVFSRSITRTSEGLEEIFDDADSKVYGIPPELFIILNSIWSLYSCWKAYVLGISSSKDHFPMKSYLVIGAFIVLSVTIKCFTTLHYLAPCLGLFNLLRHFQGELYPYSGAVSFYSNDSLFLPKIDPIPWNEYSRYNYSTKLSEYFSTLDTYNGTLGELQLTAYIHFPIEFYLHGFWVLVLIEACLILITKRLSNPTVFQRQSWVRKVTHALESCQIPAPMEDWDDQDGSIKAYENAQQKIEHEIGSTLVVNLLISLVMCIPMMILDFNVHTRQVLLERTIGAFPEETFAFYLIRILAYGYPVIVVFATILQFFLYRLYNRSQHPFYVLVKKPDTNKMRSKLQSWKTKQSNPKLRKQKWKLKIGKPQMSNPEWYFNK